MPLSQCHCLECVSSPPPLCRNEVGTFPDASISGALPFTYDIKTKCATLTYPERTAARSGMTARLRLCKPGTATDAVWSARARARVRLARRHLRTL